MKKIYLKPNIVVMEAEVDQLLSSSTVINPGGPNMPAGAREFDGLDDEPDDRQRNGGRDDEDDWEE